MNHNHKSKNSNQIHQTNNRQQASDKKIETKPASIKQADQNIANKHKTCKYQHKVPQNIQNKIETEPDQVVQRGICTSLELVEEGGENIIEEHIGAGVWERSQ